MRYISLFSGIEAASVAWEPLGWEPVAFAEIDDFASAVLAHRYPDVPNLGDVTKVDWSKYRGAAELVVGGFPCQAYSIAGLRQGLADPRGELMLEFLHACEEIDPEWVIGENVTGLLSSHQGADFQTLLEAVAILWPRGGIAWRVLDSQFVRVPVRAGDGRITGWVGPVPQRRRRVFLVINTRDWRRAAAVLLEPEGMRGDTPSSRQKREELAAAAGAGAPGRCGVVTMASGQANAEVTTDGTSPTITCLHEQPIVAFDDVFCCVDDNAKSAIDRNLCGTLKVGGGRTFIAVREGVAGEALHAQGEAREGHVREA